ncbi:Pycsar system effector family protein [Streptomyces sp. NPDC008150]|uniref:Pycsar system effector family protein n=1 Tax=Streptomyces sp. NPDC008150 TaxID=3364816 RepID=UPI0036EB6EC2
MASDEATVQADSDPAAPRRGGEPCAGDPVHVPGEAEGARALDTAWRIHSSLADGTGKVDNKAVFALSIESVMLAATAALSSGSPSPLGVTAPAGIWLLRTAMLLLAVAVLLAIAVVIPRMRDVGSRPDLRDNFTYFGHLRLWEPDPLAARLRDADPLTSLSHQIVSMSRIAWRKYTLVRLSLLIAAAGAACTALAGLAG